LTPQTDIAWYLEVEPPQSGGPPILRVRGRLSNEHSPILEAWLTKTIASGSGSVLLDLGGVDYVNSAGLAVFESAADWLGTDKHELILFNLTDPLKIALQFIGSIPNVVIEPDEASALAHVRGN
jgi:anti-anti-sigma factor